MFGKLFGKKPKISIPQMGFLQALEVTLYCTLIGLLMWNGDLFFGTMNMFFGPILMLVLFSVSVLVCGLLVFYQPYRLFFDGKKKEAADLVLYTTGWLLVSFFILLTLILFID